MGGPFLNANKAVQVDAKASLLRREMKKSLVDVEAIPLRRDVFATTEHFGLMEHKEAAGRILCAMRATRPQHERELTVQNGALG